MKEESRNARDLGLLENSEQTIPTERVRNSVEV